MLESYNYTSLKVESTLDLVEPLKKIGMTDMFDRANADLSGMTGGAKSLYVSKVVQKAFIAVDEEGAEAAAAMSGIVTFQCGEMHDRFICDRPFMFLIRDNLTNITLFTGHVTDPSIHQFPCMTNGNKPWNKNKALVLFCLISVLHLIPWIMGSWLEN
jgi:serine protease inhibitor